MMTTGTIMERQTARSPQSYWIASTPPPQFETLNADVTTDVAIIGGGIVGITTAYLLKKEGLRVVVLEADHILQGTTGHTTAKITSQHGLIYAKLISTVGEEKARLYAEANEAALRLIAGLVEEHQIDCNFRRESAYVYTNQDEYIDQIQAEAAQAAKLGLPAFWQESIPLPLPVKAALRFDNQAQFHPRRYLLALARTIPGEGSHVFEQTRATDIDAKHPYVIPTTRGHKVTAERVIVATHFPCFDDFGMYYARIYPERSYVLGMTIAGPYPGGMYISAEDPTRSLRSQPLAEREMLLVGGESHKTGHGGDTNEHYQRLREFAAATFPVESELYRWSTQDCMTMDGVPYSGYLTAKTPELYVATGFGKWGMTNGTASAMLIRDLILKGESPWQDVYNPARFTPAASAKQFFSQNLDVAAQFVTGKLVLNASEDEVPVGEGRVIVRHGQRVGAYRDERGQLHLVDTTCTHLGCELQWNAAEKTWDCPCHGSRFTYEGDIVEGPALRPLKPQ